MREQGRQKLYDSSHLRQLGPAQTPQDLCDHAQRDRRTAPTIQRWFGHADLSTTLRYLAVAEPGLPARSGGRVTFLYGRWIIRVRVDNDTYWVNYQLGELEQVLASRGFFRARRSSLSSI
jgi:hypothetical protein